MTKKTQLDQLEKSIKVCKRCKLCETALNAVPGEGNFDANIAFVGEAPGKNEDETGRPFVGRAGKLLDQMLEKIGYAREDVWIGNVIKHRPPQNRDPLPAEIKACEPFLTTQLDIIKPKLIVTLGRFGMNYFYPEGKISQIHGKLLTLEKYNIYPVYHPAAALRRREFAKALLKDFIKIPEILVKIDEKQNASEDQINPLGLA